LFVYLEVNSSTGSIEASEHRRRKQFKIHERNFSRGIKSGRLKQQACDYFFFGSGSRAAAAAT
jgi:hypothetical protein